MIRWLQQLLSRTPKHPSYVIINAEKQILKDLETRDAFHSTKNSGNFGIKFRKFGYTSWGCTNVPEHQTGIFGRMESALDIVMPRNFREKIHEAVFVIIRLQDTSNENLISLRLSLLKIRIHEQILWLCVCQVTHFVPTQWNGTPAFQQGG